MAASVQPVSHSPGFAIIDLGTGLSLQQFTFRIRRDSASPEYLDSSGRWSPTAEELTPRGIEKIAGSTRLTVGPSVVNGLLEEENIFLEVPAAGLQLSLTWPSIPHSSGDGIDDDPFGLADREDDELLESLERENARTPALGKVSPPAPIQTAATLEDNPAVTGGDTSALPPNEGQPDTATPPSTPPTEPKATHNARPEVGISEISEGPSKWRWILAVGMTLVVIGALAAWWLEYPLPSSRNTATSLPPAQPGAHDEHVRLLEEVRALVESRGDVGKIADAGQRLITSGRADLQSEGVKILDHAANRGSAIAQLALAKLFDPRYFNQHGGVTNPDSDIAAEYYRKATSSGLSAAGEELRGLCTHLQQTSTAGTTLPSDCPP